MKNLILFFSLWVWGTSGFPLTLELYDEIGSNDSIINLDRIGKLIQDKTDPVYLNLKHLAVISLPKKPKYLSSKQIFSILKKRYSIEPNIVGQGVKIYPLYTVILDQEIAEKIKSKIYDIYPDLPENSIEIMYMKIPKFPKVPAGDLEYKILVPAGKIDVTKYARLQVKQGKTELINMSIPIKIVFRVPMWVSKKSLKKGSVLKREDFFKKFHSILKYPKNLNDAFTEFFGKRTAKSLKSGETLNYKYLF